MLSKAAIVARSTDVMATMEDPILPNPVLLSPVRGESPTLRLCYRMN